uniref:Uncharacterized protein n=1 Tax=Panagrolaimus superbus TaxID=310955 RepID=A0A914YX71_9BILA
MLKLREKLGFKGPPIGIPQFFIGHIYDLMQHIFAYTTWTNGYPMGESLLQVDKEGPHGYGWKEIRSIASPTFTTGKMKMVHA